MDCNYKLATPWCQNEATAGRGRSHTYSKQRERRWGGCMIVGLFFLVPVLESCVVLLCDVKLLELWLYTSDVDD